MRNNDYRDDAPLYEDVLLQDEFNAMTDRELLLSIARDIRGAKELIAGAVAAIEPLLANPKLKLLFKML